MELLTCSKFAAFGEADGTGCVKWWSESYMLFSVLIQQKKKKIPKYLGSEQIVDCIVTSGMTSL